MDRLLPVVNQRYARHAAVRWPLMLPPPLLMQLWQKGRVYQERVRDMQALVVATETPEPLAIDSERQE